MESPTFEEGVQLTETEDASVKIEKSPSKWASFFDDKIRNLAVLGGAAAAVNSGFDQLSILNSTLAGNYPEGSDVVSLSASVAAVIVAGILARRSLKATSQE